VPELPEVETVASGLDARLRGAVVASVLVLRRDVVRPGARSFGRALVGKTVRRVRRHGKRIIWDLDPPGAELNVHLGMTGNLLLVVADAPLAAHTHLRMRFSGRSDELRFRDPRRFGGLWLTHRGRAARRGRFSRPLGPDALSIGAAQFRELLKRRRRIKALLMDQESIAGMGNIYCDESLFRARVHPLTPASDLDSRRVAALLRAMRSVLNQSIAASGSSLRDYRDAVGEPGWFRVRHRVYDREGKPCTRCATPIERIVAASRSTHYCPRCQPEP
jgi:formamidopyrimidine-DNA glycosylase